MPEDWDQDPTVMAIRSHDGSAEFWQPVRREVDRYAALTSAQRAERVAVLAALRAATAAWRANQDQRLWLSTVDKLKTAALAQLDVLLQVEDMLLAPKPAVIAAPVQQWQTAAVRAPVAVDEPPSDLSSIRVVLNTRIRRLADQRKCRVVIDEDGTLRTHDRRFRIDTGSAALRYVVALEGDRLVLYASQAFADDDARTVDRVRSVLVYPILESYAQIEGLVVVTGEFRARCGRVEWLSKQDSTWQPPGADARILELFDRIHVPAELV
jgi:hypothetical protein